MTSETLEEMNSEEGPSVEDKEELEKGEVKEDEKEEEKGDSETSKQDISLVNEDLEEKVEESKAEEGTKKGRGRRAGSKQPGQESTVKKAKKESSAKEPTTPQIERPARERKLVERYSEPSVARSSGKTFSIEKGSGTQLKEIPNVAFKLSKRKPDENLQTLHSILFGRKTKAYNLKRNIGQFSGFVWTENEEKQRAKVKERLDKCVKEKLLDFCDVLNIPKDKSTAKKEEISAKLLEFLESPHATTDVLLADKEMKHKKRKSKTLNKNTSSGEEVPAEAPTKKQKRTPKALEKGEPSSKVEEDEHLDAVEDTLDDGNAKDSNPEQSEEAEPEEQKPTKKTLSSKKIRESLEAKPKPPPVKKGKKSSTPTSKKPSKKENVEKQDDEKKSTRKKESSKSEAKAQGKGKKAKAESTKGGTLAAKAREPTKEEMHAVVVSILEEVDFNTATLSDILRELGAQFGVELKHRKDEVKGIITDVINSMPDEEDEENADEGKGGDKEDGNDDA